METICGRRVLGSTRLLRAFAEAPRLSRGARLCYLLMAAYGRDSGECYASSTSLAHDLRASKRAVKRWWYELRHAGWIHPQYVAGKPTHHVFPWHPILAAAISTGGDNSVIPPVPKLAQGDDRIVTQMYRNDVEERRRRSATTISHEDVKAHIWGYMQGERKSPVAAPDRGIVRRCVEALHGHSVEDLARLLRSLFRQGFRPGTAQGPRSYAWFPTVIEQAFGPHE
jgi:hypothetical protein